MGGRRWRRGVGWALALAVLAAPVGGGRPTAAAPERGAAAQVVPGRFIVVLEEDAVRATGVASTARAVAASAPGVAVRLSYGDVFPGFAAEVSTAATAALARDPAVAAVYPDYVVTAASQRLPTAVDRVDGDRNPTRAGDGRGEPIDADIAILDSGITPHPDLNLAGGKDCTGVGYTRDDYFHGTMVAGLAAAKDDGTGIVGAAPGARVWAIKVLDRNGNGAISSVICGLDWVAARSRTIDAVNMSFGMGEADDTSCSGTALHLAVCAVHRRDVPMMVAAGNGGPVDARIPARYPEVITVSALADSDGKPGGRGPATSAGLDDRMATFSCYGRAIDVAAPGVDAVSLSFTGSGLHGPENGTSYATPLVSGAAALIRARDQDATAEGVRALILGSAEPGPIPGDLDPYHEGVLNVADLGAGRVTAPAGGKVGAEVPVAVEGFVPGSRVAITWDGAVLGRYAVGEAGTRSVRLVVPAATRGYHAIGAESGTRRAETLFRVRPSIRLSTREGAVGDEVRVTLRGFGAGESVAVTFATSNGVRTPARITASAATGSGGGAIAVPTTAYGRWAVGADGSDGNATATTFLVHPSARARALSGGRVALELRGFPAGGELTVAWDAPAGTVATTTASAATGSRDVTFAVPSGSAAGEHRLIIRGGGGHRAVATVDQPATPTPRTATPTRVPTDTATPSTTPRSAVVATPTATAGPVDTATATPEATATGTPTATTTAASTPTATTTAASTPTETTTPTVPRTSTSTTGPTETPTATASPSPTQTPAA